MSIADTLRIAITMPPVTFWPLASRTQRRLRWPSDTAGCLSGRLAFGPESDGPDGAAFRGDPRSEGRT